MFILCKGGRSHSGATALWAEHSQSLEAFDFMVGDQVRSWEVFQMDQ